MKKINTKNITVLGVLTALSVVLVMLLHFPLIPTAAFLEYDPADIPIYIVTFLYGPASGLIITIVVSIIQGITVSSSSGLYGILMHIISTGAFVLTSGIIYHLSKKNLFSMTYSLVAGVIITTAVMIPANLIITPYFMGTPVDMVKSMLLPAIIPFNLLKQCINSAVTALVYIPVTKAVCKRG
ncbi:MAG: ECF transporter S component [Ruminococcaceae bacterium]|nr:ECF transporter S component [Oscillospiraceae bacterium]